MTRDLEVGAGSSPRNLSQVRPELLGTACALWLAISWRSGRIFEPDFPGVACLPGANHNRFGRLAAEYRHRPSSSMSVT